MLVLVLLEQQVIWHLSIPYERGKLVELADPSTLNEGLNVEEACIFMKIGLLCTQDKPKLRPSMSTVVKMLTGETDVDDEKIDKPGMLSEFMHGPERFV
ncbi:putative non-specific serine/threonine protein kinase [Rosa chinensis]|uniref:Putative non-specific serine/threonine protein kinase n=1 Tax=Rosa chinensis TaxID=74649 RepID=A0A2P6S5M7_ROSCH|nr:putative non-specific serine/threonine protein kinase [Rosa chinensis]